MNHEDLASSIALVPIQAVLNAMRKLERQPEKIQLKAIKTLFEAFGTNQSPEYRFVWDEDRQVQKDLPNILKTNYVLYICIIENISYTFLSTGNNSSNSKHQ